MGYQEAQSQIFNLVGYIPTEAQYNIHKDQSRNKLIAGGERAGKSKVNSKELLIHYAWDIWGLKKRDALYWLLGNDYEACRGEWEHIVEDFQKLEILASAPTKNIDPGEIKLQDGTRIITKSARYPEKIATVAPDGILICEAAQIDYDVFLRAKTRLAEKRGWLSMAGTFEQEDYVGWYRELFQLGLSANNLELKSFSLPTWTNSIIFPGGRTDPEILKQEAGMTHERFMERFGGEPCPKTGRVVTEFANTIHVKDCPFNKDLPVELAIDPGYAGAYAVLAIQDYGDHLKLIDEIYVQGVVTKDIILMCKKKEWWSAVQGGAIDIAARQHQAMAAPVEVWLSEGKISLQSKKVNIEDGIDLLQTHLKQHPVTGQPGIETDPKVRGFISECGGGKSPVESGGIWMRDKNTLKPIDRFNHSCKAVAYYLANKFGFMGEFTGSMPQLSYGGKKPMRTFART